MDSSNNMSQETLNLLKAQLGAPDEELAKMISTATGLIAYDLQAPAKNLYPFWTPLRNKVPRVGGGTGTATNWRQVNAIIGSGFDAMGWIPEGQRAGSMAYNTSNRSASFITLGEEDAATYEAINAGQGFEDIQARMTFRLLQKMMLKEENAILGGNASMLLGTPGTIVTSASGTGGTFPAITASVAVVALTYEGYLNSSLATGIATTKTVTGQDGKSFVLSGGSSMISAFQTQSVSGGNTLFLSIPSVQGAVAYGWFVGPAGAETLQAITTINSIALSSALVAGRQPATAITGDNSANPDYAYDGLLTTAFRAGSNAYITIQPTGTAGTGTPLTASGRGSVVEIDQMLETMWNNFQLSPTVIYVNAQEMRNITTKVLTGASAAPLVRFNTDADNPNAAFETVAGGVTRAYYNPFTAVGGQQVIPIMLHPKLPPGTIIGWAENLPVQYQSNEVPNVAEVKTRRDYSIWVH
jgi:hypothetical protein